MTPPSFKLHGDNNGNINYRILLKLPPRWVLIGSLVLAVLIAAGAIGGYCIIDRCRFGRRTITPIEDRIMQTGPRGGRYYINVYGNRTYVPKKAQQEDNRE